METVIRSCAQQCGDVSTHLTRTGYEGPTTIASFVRCCNDRDLCNAAARSQDHRQIVAFLALLSALLLLLCV